MRVTITGASGTLGLYLVAKFAIAGFDVRACYSTTNPQACCLDQLKVILPETEWSDYQQSDLTKQNIEWVELDLSSPSSVAEAVSGSDVVVHAAAIVSFHGADKDRMYDVNVNGTKLLVDTLLALNPRARLVHISSVAALGKPVIDGPFAGQITSDSQWDDSSQHTHYGKTKFLAELEVWRAVQEGLQAVILNPSIILAFGKLGQSSTTLFKYVLDGKPFHTSGFINWVDANDVAVFALIAARTDKREIINKRHVLSAGHLTYQAFFEKMAVALTLQSPKYALRPWMANLAWRLDAVRSLIFRTKPFVTREFARTAFRRSMFEGATSATIFGVEYQPLDQTLSRIGAQILIKHNNKS